MEEEKKSSKEPAQEDDSFEAVLSACRNEAGITPMQANLLRLMACGVADGDAARVLGMSPATVRGHRLRLRKRFDAARAMLSLEAAVAAGVPDGRAHLEALRRRGDAAERLRASRALFMLFPLTDGQIRDTEAAFSRQILASGREALRGLAARLLAVLRRDDALVELEALATGDPDAWVRQEAVEAVVAIDGRRGLGTLRQVLREDPRPAVRAAALLGLVNEVLGDGEVEEVLLEVLGQDGHGGLRKAVASALKAWREGGDPSKRPIMSGKGLPRERAPEDA